jgi:hypothetical protein
MAYVKTMNLFIKSNTGEIFIIPLLNIAPAIAERGEICGLMLPN